MLPNAELAVCPQADHFAVSNRQGASAAAVRDSHCAFSLIYAPRPHTPIGELTTVGARTASSARAGAADE
jgi:hypothetical protein